jgi:chromosome segregation protein
MILRKLSIYGFKSFADKIELEFGEGMTAVIGPNGCGKSNVVDAIRWVFGEQKASLLRSSNMADVIFSGTQSRQPLNVAEVTLTIENNKKILPVEYRDVSITRRIYRSGESEYLINKTQCRLRDIQNLFLDTGVGSSAYTTIENTMINSILVTRLRRGAYCLKKLPESANTNIVEKRASVSSKKPPRIFSELMIKCRKPIARSVCWPGMWRRRRDTRPIMMISGLWK